MRSILNLFLLAYFADASVSVADEVLRAAFGASPLGGVREALANAVLILSAVMYIVLGFDQRVPKRVVLPLIIYLFGALLIALPALDLVNDHSLFMALAAGQLALSIGVFFYTRSRFDGVWLVPAATFRKPAFSLRQTGAYILINLSLAIVSLPFAIYFLTVNIISANTANFLRVDTQGIYLTEKQYRNGAKSIRLIPMMHVADGDFYAEMSKTLAVSDAVILSEGVSDDRNLMEEFRGVGKAAELLGLDSQAAMEIGGNHAVYEQIGDAVTSGQDSSSLIIVRADIDSSELSPKTLEFLNQVGQQITANELMFDALMSFYRWSVEHVTPAEQEAIYAELLDKRNEVLLRHLADALSHYDQILIPWGALHMPAFEDYVTTHGYYLKDERERRAVAFWNKVETSKASNPPF